MTENYISLEGLKKLKDELERLKNVERPAIIEQIAEAREQGDLSENAEYHDAREKQSFIEGRIEELESLIKDAIVIESNKNSDVVNLGSTVQASCDDGRILKYTIVGHSEADPASGRISNESPLGKAFLGRTVGEEFEVPVPIGTIRCRIDKIE